jgi:membrane protease YdiL (CAAX protease family)
MVEELLPEPEDDHPRRAEIILFAVFFEFALALLSLFFGWLFGHPPLAQFAWSLDAALWGVVATIPLVLLFLAMLRWPVGPLARVKEFCDHEVVPLLEESTWSEIGLIAVAAGVGEEMLFRGVFQASFTSWCGVLLGLTGAFEASFASWFGVLLGLALASVLFGVMHPISVPYMVLAAFLGLYLGTVWMVGGNLLTVMVTHALYDFAALGYLLRIRASDLAQSGPST